MKISPLRMHHISLLQWQGHRILKAFHNQVLAKYQITHLEWRFLGIVHDEGDLRVTEIAERLSVRIPLVTRTVKTLLHKKKVIIEQHPKDRRVKCIAITAPGKKQLTQIEEDIQESLRVLLRGIPSKKIEIYKEVLAAIVHNGRALRKTLD